MMYVYFLNELIIAVVNETFQCMSLVETRQCSLSFSVSSALVKPLHRYNRTPNKYNNYKIT